MLTTPCGSGVEVGVEVGVAVGVDVLSATCEVIATGGEESITDVETKLSASMEEVGATIAVTVLRDMKFPPYHTRRSAHPRKLYPTRTPITAAATPATLLN